MEKGCCRARLLELALLCPLPNIATTKVLMPHIKPSKFAYRVSQILLPLAKKIERVALMTRVTYGRLQTRWRFQERESDIYLCTYPKSGTTWLQMMLFQLTTDGDLSKIQHLSKKIPHLEEEETDLNLLPEPRILKTHVFYEELPHLGKYIYIARNGVDVAHSFFHHYGAMRFYEGTFDQFFDLFMAGQVAYGSWFEHMDSWSKQKNNPKSAVPVL